MVGPPSIFKCGSLALRLLHFDEFHTSSSVNMRNATAVLVGPSNLPLFGPQGKHHGFEDSVCHHIWSTTSPRRTDNSACQGCKIILTRLSGGSDALTICFDNPAYLGNGTKKWNRTTNRSRMKRVLCQLSYPGIDRCFYTGCCGQYPVRPVRFRVTPSAAVESN